MIHVSPFEFAREYSFQYPHSCYSRIEASDYKMNISGKGSIMVQPDVAIVSLGVITENKELKVAQEENAAKSTQVFNALISSGVMEKDIKTESYTINPEYDYIEGKQVFRGYRVTHTFKVTIKDLNKVGGIIDSAVASGANMVNNISFTLSNPSIYYRQALNLAIDDAIKKAKSIEDKLSIIVNGIPISITEEGEHYIPIAAKALYSAPTATTPIKEGQIEITASVKAVFSYWTKTP